MRSSLTKNAVLVALYIVGSFISIGLLYLFLDLSLLGVILIIIYVGAVVVLFVFVSMILPLRLNLIETPMVLFLVNYTIWFFILISLISNTYQYFEYLNFFNFRLDLLQMFGLLLYTQKAWYFLIAAILLTIAIIGSILLTQNKVDFSTNKEVINLQLNKNYNADLLLYY